MTDWARVAAGWAKMKGSAPVTRFKQQNPIEFAKIDAYVTAVAAGSNPAEPQLATLFGDGFTDVVAAALAPDNPVPVPDVFTSRWYAPGSAWNTPVPASPPIHPDSAAMIQANTQWVSGNVGGNGWLRLEREVIATFVPAGTTPVTVYVDYDEAHGQYAWKDHAAAVPIPPWFFADVLAQPYTDFDRKGTFELATGDQWGYGKLTSPSEDSWVYTRFGLGTPANGEWHCVRMDWSPAPAKGWANALGFSKASDWDVGELHNRGTRVSNAAGMIRPRDTRDVGPARGVYDHALAYVGPFFAAPGQPHPTCVKPASSGDGQRTEPFATPEGARVILDPAIDAAQWCAANSVPADKQTWLLPILRTLQQYGMIGVDSTIYDPSGQPAGGIVCNHTGANLRNENYRYPWETQPYGWLYANSIPLGLMRAFHVIDWNRWIGA